MLSEKKKLFNAVNYVPNFSHESYIDHCLALAQDRLSFCGSISTIKKHEADINIYKNMDFLEEPKNISILNENCLTNSDYNRAYKCILEGRLFSEHAAAGEATRLGIGTKYLINIAEDLPVEKIAEIMTGGKRLCCFARRDFEKSGLPAGKTIAAISWHKTYAAVFI